MTELPWKAFSYQSTEQFTSIQVPPTNPMKPYAYTHTMSLDYMPHLTLTLANL